MTRLCPIFILLLIFHTNVSQTVRYDCTQPPPDVFMDDCCEFPILYNESTYRNCWTQWQTRGVLNLIQGGGISGGAGGCVAECFFNQTGIFDGDAIDLQKLTDLVAENIQFSNPFFDVVMTAMEKCVNLANMKRPRFLLIKSKPNIIMNRNNCNPISGYTLTCISIQILTNCPISQMRSGNKCEDYIDYYKYCNDPISTYL